MTITDAGHGASVGDTIVISGAVDVGGITAAQMNLEFPILTVPTVNTYTILTAGTASSSTAGGGAAIDIEYLITVGAAGQISGTGWGSGTWGSGTWGMPQAAVGTDVGIAIWSIQSYNAEDLVVHTRGSEIYYWDATTPTVRPVGLSTLPGASDTPVTATKVLVSGFDGHIIAFGVNRLGETDLNPMVVRWSDQESAVTWTPSDITTSGEKLLSQGSKIVAAVQSGDDILIFTDVAVYAMTWVGGVVTFSFELIAEGADIAGPNSLVLLRDNVYWMGNGGFYRFNGNVTQANDSIDIDQIPSSVQDFMFFDVDWTNSDKIYCGTNYTFNEVVWFYVSNDSTDGENDKYVVYNTLQNVWYTGELTRTAWVDSFYSVNPIAAGTDGFLYYHEVGADDGSTTPASAISSFIESGPFDIQDGNVFQTILRMIHDVKFRGDDVLAQTLDVELEAYDYPGQEIQNTTTATVTRSAIIPVQQFTNQTHLRIRGRQFKLKVSSDTLGTSWRFGFPRIEVRSDGKR